LRASSGLTSQQYAIPILGVIFLRFDEARFAKARFADLRAKLVARFKRSKTKQATVEAIRAAVQGKLQSMLRIDCTRSDFLERFENLINEYNAGSRNIEQLCDELLNLSQPLDHEQRRHAREGLSEKELVLFDILTRPSPDLTPDEVKSIKKVARSLWGVVQARLVLNWHNKLQALRSRPIRLPSLCD
jgi:type I restriction enzyme R subunit